MSNEILEKLKLIKPFIKTKGLPFDQYGLVLDQILYVTNGIVQLEIPIPLPFNAVINLYELLTILSTIKTESVIVAREDGIVVQSEDMVYQIHTLPIDSFTYVDVNLLSQFVDCNNPQIFSKMAKIAVDYVQPISNENAIQYAVELMHIQDGVISFSDRKNMFQAILDFVMPNMGIPYHSLFMVSKLIKSDTLITGFNLDNNLLGIRTNLFTLYIPVIITEHTKIWSDKMTNILNSISQELGVNVTINSNTQKQLKIAMALSRSKYVFFNNTFCQSDENKIEYPKIGDSDFSFKINVTNLNNILSLSEVFKITNSDKLLICNGNVRGVIGGVKND